jgi:hypothetical protein
VGKAKPPETGLANYKELKQTLEDRQRRFLEEFDSYKLTGIKA